MILLALAATSTTEAFAQAPTGKLFLRDALALTLKHNPELAVFSAEVRIADARLLQAGLRPNPELELTSENVTGSGDYDGAARAETTLLLGQLIELGGKRRARMREATAALELASFDYEAKKREAFRKTAEHFVEVLTAQRRVALQAEIVRQAEDFVPAMQKRIEAGKTSEVEKARFDLSIANERIGLAQAEGDLRSARQHLAAQWNSQRALFSEVSGDLDQLPPVGSLDSLTAKLASHPKLARFEIEKTRGAAMVAREKATAFPDVTLRGGARQLAESGDAAAVVGISVPLPLWNRNRGNIQAARAQMVRVQAEHAVTRAALQTELSDAYHDLVRARSTIDALRETILPGGENALEAINEGYEAGRFSGFEVLDARRTAGAARLQYLQALTDYHKARHAIEALTAEPRLSQ